MNERSNFDSSMSALNQSLIAEKNELIDELTTEKESLLAEISRLKLSSSSSRMLVDETDSLVCDRWFYI